MGAKFTRLIVLAGIIFAIYWELRWTFGYRNLASPSSAETRQAIHAFQANPSDGAKATMLEQIHRDVSHNEKHNWFVLGLMLLGDVLAIYFFCQYWRQKSTA